MTEKQIVGAVILGITGLFLWVELWVCVFWNTRAGGRALLGLFSPAIIIGFYLLLG